MLTETPEEKEQFMNLFRFINEDCGIRITQKEAAIYEDQLRELLDETDCESFDELCKKGECDKESHIKDKLIDTLTPNETLWFRNREIWELLGKLIRKKANKKLRLWSAGCSSGQEVYSLSMLLDHLKTKGYQIDRSDIEILGTDISPSLLFMAISARYNNSLIENGLKKEEIDNYFEKDEDNEIWTIRDELKQNITFKRHNLLDNLNEFGTFDYILCRNVSYYFSEKFINNFFNNIHNALSFNGILILGRTESIPNPQGLFEEKQEDGITYYIKK